MYSFCRVDGVAWEFGAVLPALPISLNAVPSFSLASAALLCCTHDEEQDRVLGEGDSGRVRSGITFRLVCCSHDEVQESGFEVGRETDEEEQRF